MPSSSIILAAILVVFAGIALIVCWIALLIRTFRESILWGVLTFLFPIVGLVFMLLHWEENKRLFVAYLGSTLLFVAAIISTVPIMRVATSARNGGSIKPQRVVAPLPVPAAKPVASASVPALSPLEKTIQQKRLELKELYDSLDQWAKRLMVKRGALKTATPQEVQAFNEEYAGYQAALKDYKNQSGQIEQLQAERLLQTTGGEKKAPMGSLAKPK